MSRRATLMRLLLPLAAALLPAAGRAESGPCKPCWPGSFDSLEISGSANVRFTQGSSDQVSIEGDEETQKSVELEVRGGVLYVRPGGSWKFWSSRRAQLDITARELRRLTITGAADVVATQAVQCQKLEVQIAGAGLARFDKLQANYVRFQVSGAGDGQMAGTVNELQIELSGRGEFRGENLKSERARVQVSGIGDVQVWATQWLGVNVSGVGTVDYWGSPQVQRRSAGIARINDRGPKAAPP
jgi:Putative auto-transporter adhesin, head GIN domain